MKKAAVLLLAFFSCLLSADPVHFVSEDLPPYHFKGELGQPKGALVDIVKAIAKEAKVDYTIEIYPFSRAFHLLKNKPNVLMFSLLKSPSREKQFVWLGKIFHNSAFLVALNGNKPRLTSLAQAKDYTVGTIRGYYSERYLRKAGFEEGENLSLSVKYQHLWQMLFNHRIDYVLTNTLSLNSELNELRLKMDDIESTLELTDFPNELHLAGNLSLPPKTIEALRQAFITIKSNGEHQRILTQWGLQ